MISNKWTLKQKAAFLKLAIAYELRNTFRKKQQQQQKFLDFWSDYQNFHFIKTEQEVKMFETPNAGLFLSFLHFLKILRI